MEENLQKILSSLEELKRATLLGVKEVLDVHDVAALTGLSVSRVRTLCSQHVIPYYKPNGKLFFKKDEINAWLLTNRHDSAAEIASQATTHVVLSTRGPKRYRDAAQ